jgi:bacterioferritin-associated ferredoxin
MVSLMYVCLCVVTDGQIRDAIYEGCCSYKEVRAATNVASQCGKCACLAKQVVRETLTELQVSPGCAPLPRRIYRSVKMNFEEPDLCPVFLCLKFNKLAFQRGSQTFLFLLIFTYYSIT